MRRITRATLSALFVLPLVLACGGDEKTVESADGKTQIQTDGEGGVSVTGEDGRTFEVSPEGAAALPNDFPGDVPKLSDAETVMSSSTPAEGMMLMLRTGDEPKDVFDFYKEGLADESWEISREANMGGQHLLTATKDGRELNIMIGGPGEGGKTQVALRLKNKG